MIPMEVKLLDLFARLSLSSARIKVFAARAKKDGRPELARLFLAMAESQKMQAKRFLMQIRGAIDSTDENEKSVFAVSLPLAIEEYKKLMEEADRIGSKALSTGFRHSGEVDSLLLELHEKLHEQDPETDYYVCDFCGYVANDEPPDNCPICTAPKNRFQKVQAG